jgi:hypothetical protein
MRAVQRVMSECTRRSAVAMVFLCAAFSLLSISGVLELRAPCLPAELVYVPVSVPPSVTHPLAPTARVAAPAPELVSDAGASRRAAKAAMTVRAKSKIPFMYLTLLAVAFYHRLRVGWKTSSRGFATRPIPPT